MSETYMVMVLVPIMAPFTCIGAGETRATQIWARVTTRAAVGTAGGRRAGRPEPRCPPSRSGIEWPRPSSAGYFRDDRWSRRRAPDPAPVVGVGVVIQHRHVGDLLAIVARVKPIAVIVGVESRRHHRRSPGWATHGTAGSAPGSRKSRRASPPVRLGHGRPGKPNAPAARG